MKVRKQRRIDEFGGIQRLNHLEIKSLIDKHLMTEIPRLDKLELYYQNKNPRITSRTMDAGKPNNKICNPYAYYITSMVTGYFMGKPIQYQFDDKYQDVFEKLLAYNDEIDVNNNLATNCSKFGWAVEQEFLDEDANIRFAVADNREVIYIVTSDVIEDVWCVIRHWVDHDLATEKDYTYVEVYYDDEIHKYSYDGEGIVLTTPVIELNPFNDVPFVIYQNNHTNQGDYELITDLIDAYDQVQSDTANDFEYFTDAYLQVSGVTVDEEEAKKLKQLRIFNFPDANGKVQFVTKNINDTALENYKNRLNQDIHNFSLVPDMSDKEFASNSSGVSIKYKLQGLEYLCAIKESKFKKGLLRRLELMINILNKKTVSSIEMVGDIDINFTRNTVDNLVEIVEMVNKLTGIISKESQLDIIPFIKTSKELERLEAESNSNIIEDERENDFFNQDIKSLYDEMNKTVSESDLGGDDIEQEENNDKE